MTRQQRKDGRRDAGYASRYDREALAAACDQCQVSYGPVETQHGVPFDDYVRTHKVENGVIVETVVPASWEMVLRADPLIYVGA